MTKRIELQGVIATRQFELPDERRTVTLLIGTPQETAEYGFITPYKIEGAGDETVRFAAGIDAVQSLQLVFKIIGADLYYGLSDHKIRWEGSEDLGFPKP